MSKQFLEFDVADFSNTNKAQLSLAEIRRDSYTEGFIKGKEQGRADALTEVITHISACENEAYANCEPIVGSVLMAMRIKAEQLKEQTNDIHN